MCRAYHKTAKILNGLIRNRILRNNELKTYDEIIKALQENGAVSLRYSATTTIGERLNHLRAKRVLDFDYATNRYKKKKTSFRYEKKKDKISARQYA